MSMNAMEGIRFTKIKFDGFKVLIQYERERKDGDPDEFSLHSSDRPAPEFDQTLQALAQDVVKICELSADDTSKLTVRGVSLTWAHDILGAVITGLKSVKTANSPLVLNTPHLPEASYSESDGDTSPVMHAGLADRLGLLMDQAMRYVDGDRAQADLFASDSESRVILEIGGATLAQQ